MEEDKNTVPLGYKIEASDNNLAIFCSTRSIRNDGLLLAGVGSLTCLLLTTAFGVDWSILSTSTIFVAVLIVLPTYLYRMSVYADERALTIRHRTLGYNKTIVLPLTTILQFLQVDSSHSDNALYTNLAIAVKLNPDGKHSSETRFFGHWSRKEIDNRSLKKWNAIESGQTTTHASHEIPWKLMRRLYKNHRVMSQFCSIKIVTGLERDTSTWLGQTIADFTGIGFAPID